MKIAMLYGPFSTAGRLFDLREDLNSNPSGMTGSETSFFYISKLLHSLGNEVTIFAPIKEQCDGMNWHGLKIRKYQDILTSVNSDFHAAYAWNEPNLLRNLDWHIIRMCNLQINCYFHCAPDCDDWVDVWTSPSDSHRSIIGPECPKYNSEKWFTVHNGCDPSLYSPGKHIPGRVIWASSPDRGLHWLLSIWPRIREYVPHAQLKIFYRLRVWLDHFLSADPRANPTYPELINRAQYINESIRKLKGHGIEVCDSISRNDMTKEMNEAQVLAYTCDPILYTEGFSVSIMEACASGTLPIITDADALKEIYGSHVPMVNRPMPDSLKEYTDLVIRSLTDQEFFNDSIKKSISLSYNYQWKDIAFRVDSIIREQRIKRGWTC